MDTWCSCCLESPELPGWSAKVEVTDEYMAALDERYAPIYEGPDWKEQRAKAMEALTTTPKVKGQSKLESFIEATMNTLSGFIISYLVWVFVAGPLFNIPVNYMESFWITCLFTVTSVARSYVWRRLFNHRSKKVNA